MTQFRKGQTVYQACGHLSQDIKAGVITMAVIERRVDACGKKVLTFAERGNDFVFGKSVRNWNNDGFSCVYATPTEAFAALRAAATDSRYTYLIIAAVQSDGDAALFDNLRAGKLEAKAA